MMVAASPYHYRAPSYPVDLPLTSAFLKEAYGSVKHGLYIKRYVKAALTADKARRLSQQIAFLPRTSHAHILPLCAVHEDDAHIYIVFESFETTLKQAVMKATIDESKLQRDVVPGILEALQYLECKGILHKNVSAKTIVYSRGAWKLTGFQDAVDLRLHAWDTVVGFRRAIAIPPELLTTQSRDREQASKVAVFALGILLYDILVPNKKAMAYGDLSPVCRNFIAQCTKSDPLVRWTVDALRRHPWLGDNTYEWIHTATTHFPDIVDRFTSDDVPSPKPKKKRRWLLSLFAGGWRW
jgi:serine/threonine protein kinase